MRISDWSSDVCSSDLTFHHDSAADMPSAAERTISTAGNDHGSGYSEDGPDFDSFSAPALSLQEHLLAQAGSALSGQQFVIATQLIGQMDEAGYLEANLLETAYRLNVALNEVEAVLGVIHTFDPTGVGARSLAECIALQAKEADRYDPAMARLIDNLELLGRGALPQLKRICGVDDEDMADMIRELRAYDPKPGLKYGSDISQAIVPALLVMVRAGGWSIEINNANLPRLLVNPSYYVELTGGQHDRNSKARLAECLASGNWLIKAHDQWQRTILKVAGETEKDKEDIFRQWSG